MNTNTTQLIALRVEAGRTVAGKTRALLARETGIPLSTLRRKLAGHDDFTVPQLQAACVHLGLSFITVISNLPKVAA